MTKHIFSFKVLEAVLKIQLPNRQEHPLHSSTPLLSPCEPESPLVMHYPQYLETNNQSACVYVLLHVICEEEHVPFMSGS